MCEILFQLLLLISITAHGLNLIFSSITAAKLNVRDSILTLFRGARCSFTWRSSIFSRVSTSSYGDRTLKAYIGRDEPSCHAREVFLDIDRCCLEETLYRLSRISFEDKARARLRFDIAKFREILRSRC